MYSPEQLRQVVIRQGLPCWVAWVDDNQCAHIQALAARRSNLHSMDSKDKTQTGITCIWCAWLQVVCPRHCAFSMPRTCGLHLKSNVGQDQIHKRMMARHTSPIHTKHWPMHTSLSSGNRHRAALQWTSTVCLMSVLKTAVTQHCITVACPPTCCLSADTSSAHPADSSNS